MSIVGCSYSTVGQDMFGKAIDGSINVRGTTNEASLRYSSESSSGYKLCVQGTNYQSNTDQRTICEFSIDAHHAVGIGTSTKEKTANTVAGNLRRAEIRAMETPILWLSL